MSDSNSPYSYAGLSGQLQSRSTRDDSHGASIRISDSCGIVYHQNSGYSPTTPTVRSYKDGLRVGCTFVTSEALERLYALHKSFLSSQDSKTHQ